MKTYPRNSSRILANLKLIRLLKWAGKTNGELLKLMISEKFDALLTFDKNLQHQQNFKKYTLAVFVLGAINNTYKSVQPLSILVKEYLKSDLLPGPIEIKIEK